MITITNNTGYVSFVDADSDGSLGDNSYKEMCIRKTGNIYLGKDGENIRIPIENGKNITFSYTNVSSPEEVSNEALLATLKTYFFTA